MDAGEDVSQPCLRIEAIHFGGFDQCHRTSQRFGPCISASKEPVLSAYANWPESALGRIVVDRHTAVGEEQTKRRSPAQAIAEGFRQIPFAGKPGELVF